MKANINTYTCQKKTKKDAGWKPHLRSKGTSISENYDTLQGHARVYLARALFCRLAACSSDADCADEMAAVSESRRRSDGALPTDELDELDEPASVSGPAYEALDCRSSICMLVGSG